MSELERFYARQSRLIDDGNAVGWAATFTADGVFDSPSYPRPARGTDELVAFARGFHDSCVEQATRLRHVVTNVDVVGYDATADPAPDLAPDQIADEVEVRAYLQIVATPAGQDSRLVRLTTITDRLVRRADGAPGWQVAHRAVRRDDVAPEPVREGAPA
ncbi:nuclear transport factor 2 family protein [Nocardioides sp. C4-1]|uniref:nuclear transport factor 2 family protein n=1 Tax=Nocardioides sp. C4-1 TaxID=3151851 RepID=UPI003265D4B2